MNASQKLKLFYKLIAWSIWLENSPSKSKAIRDVKIQCGKLFRMFHDPLITPSDAVIAAGKPSKKTIKKRGQANRRLAQQAEHIRYYIEKVVKDDAALKGGEPLTKAAIRIKTKNIDTLIDNMSSSIEKKYGSRTKHLIKD